MVAIVKTGREQSGWKASIATPVLAESGMTTVVMTKEHHVYHGNDEEGQKQDGIRGRRVSTAMRRMKDGCEDG